MLIVFPNSPINLRAPDPSFEAEVKAAEAAGFQVGLFDTEIQFGGTPKLRGVPMGGDHLLYRGWLMRPDRYEDFERIVQAQKWELVTNHAQYMAAYSLPEWYEYYESVTPKSIWSAIEGFDAMPGGLERSNIPLIAKRVARVFGDNPVILKDYVKSRKHEWHDACFIRRANDQDDVLRVVQNFMRLQGEDLYGGLVFRKFESFQQVGLHPKSKMPLLNEWRLFFWRGELIALTPYWKDGVEADECMPPSPGWTQNIQQIVRKQALPFVCVDCAQMEDSSDWMVIEINDAGAAGIPDSMTPTDFYAALSAAQTHAS